MALPGAPIGPDILPNQRKLVFDHMPRLRELIKNGGWPGVVYAQVCVPNLKAAHDRTEFPANLRAIRNSQYYSVRGPKGEAQMALVGCGEPIAGAAPEGGERLFFTDGEAGQVTGLKVRDAIWFTAAERVEVNLEPEIVESVPDLEPPRQTRPYKRKKPWGTPAQKKALAMARANTQRNAHGRATSKGDPDGTRSVEPSAQAGAGQSGQSDGGVQGGDAA